MPNNIKPAGGYRVRYQIEHLAKALKRARKEQGITQRALSAETGIVQAQISLIERGCVNLSLETFIQLARALQLEPMLVPRKYIPLVQSLARGDMGGLQRPMCAADREDDD